MKKNYCVLCRLYFGVSNPYRQKRREGDVHDYCILKYEKEAIFKSCRKFLLGVGGTAALGKFMLESSRVRSLATFVSLLSDTLSEIWIRTPNKESRSALTAFAAKMSKTLTLEVRVRTLRRSGANGKAAPLS